MSAAIKLSRKTASALLELLPEDDLLSPTDRRFKVDLRAALKPKRSVKFARARKTAKKASKREETSNIYREVEQRADGLCEMCGDAFSPLDPPEMDHARGKGRAPQSVENCWMLHGRSCHRRKHNGLAVEWLTQYRLHAEYFGYSREMSWADGRLAFVTARTKLARVGT